MRRLLSFLTSLLLMAAFYVYAVMREDSETKRTEQWVVAAEQTQLAPSGGALSTDSRALVRALGAAVPLPRKLLSGRVEDASWHGYYARRLTADDGVTRVSAVRPMSAAPLIRGASLTFASHGRSLYGFPLLEAEDEDMRYLFLITGDAAVMIVTPVREAEASLQAMQLVEP